MPSLLLFLALTAVSLPAGRYCVTPLRGNATDGVYVPTVVIDVAPEKATGAKGTIVALRFPTVAAAKDGARGACWALKRAPKTEKRPNVYIVVGAAP